MTDTDAENNLPPHLGENDRVVLFDGVCKLCNVSANFIIQHDTNNQFKLASVQSIEGENILKHFGYPLELSLIHI